MSLDGSCDCPEQDRTPLPRPTWRRVNVRTEVLDLKAQPYAIPQEVKFWLSGNPCLVPGCGHLAGDGFVCRTCVEEWEVHLGNVTALVEDLEVAARKQVKFGGRGGNPYTTPVRSAIDIDWTTERHIQPSHMARTDQPTPSDSRAAYWLDRLQTELVGQIRLICETNSIDVPPLGDDTVAMSQWLLGQADQLPRLPEQDGWGLVHDLDQVYQDCVNTIDAPKRHKYVRVCDCGLSVWAGHDSATTTCACGKVYNVAAEYEARMTAARDRRVTLREAAILAKVPLNTVRSWAGPVRARLDVWVDQKGERLVRFGDVADLAATRRSTA